MNTIAVLLLLPLVTAVLLLLFSSNKIRGVLVAVSAVVLSGAAIYLAWKYFGQPSQEKLIHAEILHYGMIAVDTLIAAFLIYLGFRHKRGLVVLLSALQLAALLWFEFFGAHAGESADFHLLIDKLSIFMVCIIAIVGGAICVFAVSYMKNYHEHHHKEVKDRRKSFFALLFVFLTAMFGIVLCNDLLWIFFFWELTTLFSFLLIRYTRTEEANNNAFRALILNLIGGAAFLGAIIYWGQVMGITELHDVLRTGGSLLTLIPVALIAIAALTKSAQLPFSRWLLGAMVAPTPTSALLHSSTMVKAGVYLLIRISPLLAGNAAGLLVIIAGGVTFLWASLLAISQSDAKKVLAYSTIANLGLIVACAGVGTPESIWAAIMLILFHAVSKSLLFLCVGTVEKVLGSRDIEDMHGLIVRQPFMALMMTIGIAGMFLAPFGMLISKWAALKAFIDSNNMIIMLLLVFGSAATLFYWTKWLGKLAAVLHNKQPLYGKVEHSEGMSLSFLASLVILLCLTFPLVSRWLVEPFISDLFGMSTPDIIGAGNQNIMSLMLLMIVLLPVGMRLLGPRNVKILPSYMGGINTGDNEHFIDSYGKQRHMYLANWYLDRYFGEKRLLIPGIVTGIALLLGMMAYVVGIVLRGV